VTSRDRAAVRAGPAQTIGGFGASGAWWPNDLARFRPEVREEVAALLFAPGPRGIALSVYRYNIGGGGTGVTDPSRAPETFLVRPGVYDWNRDPGGRLFLRLASRWGVPILLGFVNSAPGVWTTTGSCCGGALVPGAEPAFARYLVDVVSHLREAEGVSLAYLSPMNEPAYHRAGCRQEGMAVPPQRRAALVRAVGRELAARAPEVGQIADESSRVEQFLAEAPLWLSVEDAPRWLAALAHHLYDFPDAATLDATRRLGERYGLPLWSTEISCMRTDTGAFGQQYDPTIAGAMDLANLVWQGLSHANDAAFHWWVAASPALGADPVEDPEAPYRVNGRGYNDGLLYYDPDHARNGNQRIYLTKRYHALGNFSRYVRPEAVRHEVEDVPAPLRVLAFSGAPGWTVVAINNAPPGSPPIPLELTLPARDLAPVETVETSHTHNLDPVPPPSVRPGGHLDAILPAQSITTFVLASRYPRR
jgi:O-glycosyl hydrolase